jgi:GTP-binding protein
VLAFLIPIDSMDWQAEYEQLRGEVASYSADLAHKPHFVVFTKMDLLGETEPPPIDAPEALGMFAISSAARQGLDTLLAAWWSQLLELRKQSEREAAASKGELP